MKKLNIPEGYQAVMPYLIIKDAKAFRQWCMDVLDATEKMTHYHEDQSILHAEIFIGESTVMLAEAGGPFPVNNAGMFVYVQDADDAYARAMAHGATSLMEPANQPYGRTSGVRDPFGNTWWITTADGKMEA